MLIQYEKVKTDKVLAAHDLDDTAANKAFLEKIIKEASDELNNGNYS